MEKAASHLQSSHRIRLLTQQLVLHSELFNAITAKSVWTHAIRHLNTGLRNRKGLLTEKLGNVN